MINPFTTVHEAVQSCLLPVLGLMSGSLVLGTMIGWTGRANGRAEVARLRKELERERKAVADMRVRLERTSTILNQRQRSQEEESARAQQGGKDELAALNAKIAALKLALAAAKRPTPVTNEDPFRHATRIAELEREAARIPKLMKELEELRAQQALPVKRLAPAKPSAAKQALPEQVYRVMSAGFGKRIEPNDLELVEGIGPKIAEHLQKHGLKTWSDLAAAKPAQLRKVLDTAGDRFQLQDPTHWPEQCKLMVENRWDELRKYQRKLSSAR